MTTEVHLLTFGFAVGFCLHAVSCNSRCFPLVDLWDRKQAFSPRHTHTYGVHSFNVTIWFGTSCAYSNRSLSAAEWYNDLVWFRGRGGTERGGDSGSINWPLMWSGFANPSFIQTCLFLFRIAGIRLLDRCQVTLSYICSYLLLQISVLLLLSCWRMPSSFFFFFFYHNGIFLF